MTSALIFSRFSKAGTVSFGCGGFSPSAVENPPHLSDLAQLFPPMWTTEAAKARSLKRRSRYRRAGRKGLRMEFGLTEEQRELQKCAHDFAEKEIRPVAPHYAESWEFPWDVLKKSAWDGLYCIDAYVQAAEEACRQ